MVRATILYALADSVPLWKVPLVVGLVLFIVTMAMLAWDAYRDE